MHLSLFLLQHKFALFMTYKAPEGGIVIRPVTSLGSQGGRRVIWQVRKFLNYVQ